MAKKTKIKPLTAALGAGFTISLTLSPITHAADNPFEVISLGSGYMVADGHEGKCGEGKCGEGKCGEGKCGEGKCGDKKTSDSEKDKKDSEGVCGG